MGEKYAPKLGDRVRVVLEDEVYYHGSDGFEVGDNFVMPDKRHVVSIERVEPPLDLPDGLTVSEDEGLINWRGVNYVRQDEPVVETVEVFKPGDVVRHRDGEDDGRWYAIAEDGWLITGPGWIISKTFTEGDPSTEFTSDIFEKVPLG